MRLLDGIGVCLHGSTLPDPALLAFIDRIAVREDPEIEAMGRHFRHACRMTVRTADGRAFAHDILHRRGSPQSAVGWPEVTEKFRSITRDLLGPVEQDRVCGLVRNLGRAAAPAGTLDALCAIVARPVGPCSG